MTVFILSLFSSGNKLRVSSLFHLITGKRTTSVLIYGFVNDLLFAHNSFPKLTQEEFQQLLDQLQENRLLLLDDNEAMITSAGKEELERVAPKYQGLRFDRYGRTYNECWRLLKFAVQVVSNLAGRNQDYLPAETSPFYMYQVKKWLAQMNLPRHELIETMYEELFELFSRLDSQVADFLANQFSGTEKVGLLPYQLSDDAQTPEIFLEQAKSTHLLLAEIEKKPEFLIYQLLSPLFTQNHNQSMLITREMIKNGHSIETVMAQRHLKKGTVTDHLIEWALFFDDFPYESLVSLQTKKQLSELDVPVRDWQYKAINEDGKLDYGEFRFYQIQLLKGESVHDTAR
ncbi:MULTISPECIES: helix-turn-helix domain-containing protein [unclassified Enterococcus]|uniref:helix-turn-helix domain-containing protein n=1 Tax=unclassified Enterococcus TaxID=2608891 RepID=UPI0013EDBED4|nr:MULTISPECIES: helix-turn-helix domain-containing protein [unclassified Enterococcus]